MVERYVYANLRKIENPTLRGLAVMLARTILDNWFYLLFVVFLWRFPYIIADQTGSEVMPRRPSGDSAFWQSEMARAMVIACLAMSYNLLFGFSGIVSFGHALFFGAGGYVTFMLLNSYDPSVQTAGFMAVVFLVFILAAFVRLSLRPLVITGAIGLALVLILLPHGGDISFYQAAAVAILISIAVSLLSGMVTLRLKGIYFAMFTMALAEMFWVLAKSGTFRDITGAEDGLGFRDVLPEALNPTTTFNGNRMDMYRVTVIFFVLVFLAIRRYMNSPVGRVMLAVRENEQRARTIGYNTLYYKILTMTFSGVIATMSGLLFVIWSTDKRVHPEILSLKYTVDPLLNTLIGGVGTLTGPVVAALGLTLGETYLRNETFTLSTKLLGVLAVWQVFAILVVAILVGALRRMLSQGGDRLVRAMRPAFQQGSREYRRFMQVYTLGVFVVLLAAGLGIGSQIVSGSDLKTKTYMVSDLWELFLGALFVIVVMALPNGIVGTWNRWHAQRRIRRMERELQAQKGAEHAR